LKRHLIVPFGELNGVPITLVARSGVISKSMDRPIGVVMDKGVFGNPDNNIDESDNSNVSKEQISDHTAKNKFVNSTDNVIETPKMNNHVNNEGTKSNKTSYAKIVNNKEYVEDKKLHFKPNEISENRDEFVVFDKELVQKVLEDCGAVSGHGNKNCVKRPQITDESKLNKEEVKSANNDKEDRKEKNSTNGNREYVIEDEDQVNHNWELRAAISFINYSPWFLAGDFNVTLKLNEHSVGGSSIFNDMQDLIDCVNDVEIEDISKRRKLSEEAKEANDLRKRLEIVQDEDDVFVEATPLAQKVPVVDYQIVVIDNKP
nr:RNA-directed DNA polymerase, eukaryota, reverse transcriptase zinc-binding domain protein [Tanacetum cinerariifolium]